MPRSYRMIALAAIGLAASIALPGCAHRANERPAPSILAVAVKDPPPADLLICPTHPEGFPADAAAVMPAPVRAAIIRLATAYAAVSGQLVRLIDWENGKPCAEVLPHE